MGTNSDGRWVRSFGSNGANPMTVIWLADLTYTQQTIASDIIPAGVGMIGEFVEQSLPGMVDIEIFKFPEELADRLSEGAPDIIGFSNYIWNSSLSYAFAERIREVYPSTVTVMGGPNFPTVLSEQEAFVSDRPAIDFFVTKEGEVAFLRLIEALMEAGMNKSGISDTLPNVVFQKDDGAFVASLLVERITDLTLLPSPYLSGKMDPFIDGRLLPVIQTNRGCPFACTFCTEGQGYWSKVRRKSEEVIRKEIRYIADKLSDLPKEKRRSDLLIADSNFGMFKEDLDVCQVIADVQEERDYPRYINVATGKNKKERVLDAARIVNGAMKLAGSVQSLDENVLDNIKRRNISASEIVDLALSAGEIGTNTYSEVILALPGDSVEGHFSTLKTLVDSGFNMISMYQLMILPGTELGLDETKLKYDMTCRFRVLPRCFGVYDVVGKTISVAEIEEICVSNNTLSYQDYLSCRTMDFIVNVFYNDGVFEEIIQLLGLKGLSCWAWLEKIYDYRPLQFQELIDAFISETEGELWTDKEALKAQIDCPEIVEKYIEGEIGNNLMFTYKALSMTRYFPTICDVALTTAVEYLRNECPDDAETIELAEDIVNFKRMQLEDLFDDAAPRHASFKFDVAGFASAPTSERNGISKFRYPEPRQAKFRQSDEQIKTLNAYTDLFGNDLPGLTRILSRVYVKQLFRQVVSEDDQVRIA